MLSIVNKNNEKLEKVIDDVGKLTYKKIGLTYVQYFGKATPAELYGGTWKAIYDSDGVFFRTPGGNALAFNGTIQGDATRNVVGGIWGGSVNACAGLSLNGSGVFVGSPGGGDKIDHNPNVAMESTSVTFDLSRQVPTASEIRPRNVTIRVWECIG